MRWAVRLEFADLRCSKTEPDGDDGHERCRPVAESEIVARWLIIAGVVLIVVGVAWPFLAKLGLGRLPGDIRIEREGFSFYFPLTTGLIISIVLSLILWLLRK